MKIYSGYQKYPNTRERTLREKVIFSTLPLIEFCRNVTNFGLELAR
jgi:hypothetical protein